MPVLNTGGGGRTESIPSKVNYVVIKENDEAGTQFNNASGVIVTPDKIYNKAEVPTVQPVKWIINRCRTYALENGVIGEHLAPALGDDVKVSVGGIKNILNHLGSDVKNNLIAYIPQMLKNAVFIQTESNKNNLSHLLAAKVRYGGERFIVGMVVHENNGKFYYDHELIEIKNAEYRSLPDTTGVDGNSASIINVIQNHLFSTGFEKKMKIILNFAKNACTGR